MAKVITREGFTIFILQYSYQFIVLNNGTNVLKNI
jgi:hypothetical protein